MPDIQCFLTLNRRLLLMEGENGWLPLQCAVAPGESPLAACVRVVKQLTGFHVSPSCAGVIYAAREAEHDYTLVFVADAPAEGSDGLSQVLHWVDLQDIPHRPELPSLQRTLVPLLLTADGPQIVFLDREPETEEPALKEAAPIAHARLSPLVFAVA